MSSSPAPRTVSVEALLRPCTGVCRCLLRSPVHFGLASLPAAQAFPAFVPLLSCKSGRLVLPFLPGGMEPSTFGREKAAQELQQICSIFHPTAREKPRKILKLQGHGSISGCEDQDWGLC